MTELFIEKAKIIHGNKYDYLKVDYKNNSTKVIILCKEHGEFTQNPYNHLNGAGCGRCAGTAKYNTDEFIEKVKLIHGDKYNYSKVNYKNSITKTIIICKEHGEFEQTPKLHLNGAGCGKCVGTAKSNTKEFIEKSKLIHEDKYDYSMVDYKNCNTEVIIICKIHGEFKQKPNNHLNNYGCSKCSGNYRMTINEFIEKFKEKYGELYDYSKIDYKNSRTKIKIICKAHGEFEQTPYQHLKSNGCQKCSGNYTMTTNEFIEKSIKIHGDTYDYSKVDYKNCNTEVIIICKIHGEFKQKPFIHYWNKSGCPKCANKNVNTKDFIEKAKLIHGNLYDYSKTEYLLSNKEVIITCKEHGDFNQIPNTHLNGHGCSKCGGVAKSNTNEFIEKAKFIHANKYDYYKVNYINNITDVIIICKIHGEYLQTPKSHLKGHKCIKCYQSTISERLLQTTEEFIERSKKIHGDKYDYSKVDYINNNKKVIIICKKHGEFYQGLNHYRGAGCSKCSGVFKLTTNEFIERSKKIHGDKYDYSKINYINNNTKVIIICKIHGEFYQNPGNHYLQGHGCPKCCNNNYSKMQILWLDFLSKFHNIHIQHALNEGEFVIPNTNFKADGYCKETNTIYEFHGDFWHGNPNIYKQDEINKKTNCSFKELYEKTLIKENKIKELGYNLEIIWEKDWKKINNVKIIQQKFINRFKCFYECF
jgi:predicted nucleic-acid-binding Zn-ribbon protein